MILSFLVLKAIFPGEPGLASFS